MLDEIKKLLGFDDSENDAILNTIVSLVESRLKYLIAEDTVPDSLSYIVTEVSISRFNRIGSEGVSSHDVEGEKMTWSNDDFRPYMSDIEQYVTAQKGARRGRVRFI